MQAKPLTSLALTLLAAPSAAQMTASAGPNPVPVGCPVSVSLTNDTELIAAIFNCQYVILDESLEVVFTPDCLQLELLVGPLGTVTWLWPQEDDLGQQVPPGNYFAQIGTITGPVLAPVTIGATETGIFLEGTPAIGTSEIGLGGRPLVVCSPQDPGETYAVLASFSSSQGIPTCGGTIPLDLDALFTTSLSSSALIPNGVGLLDSRGYSDAPLVPIPDNANLIGLGFSLAFVVLDTGGGCPIARISDALDLVVQEGPIPFPG